MRLDVYLVQNNIYQSRARAVRAIESGCVLVNGKVILKNSTEITETDLVEAAPDPLKYVSRGALKLDFALKNFDLKVSGLTAVDIGASTGGFTQVLLENGAEKVYAVDVGTGQLDPLILKDERVVNLEKTDIRNLPLSEFGDFFDISVCDCSFISLTKILPSAFNIMKNGAVGVFLIKPQFEVGKKGLDKRGVVKNPKDRVAAVEMVVAFAESIGFKIKNPPVESVIKGGDGNVEYIMVVEK